MSDNSPAVPPPSLAWFVDVSNAGLTGNADWVYRVWTTPNDQLQVKGLTTEQFSTTLIQLFNAENTRYVFACKTLGGVIDALKTREIYNTYYRDFLTGSLTQDEFDKAAADLEYAPIAQDASELSPRLQLLVDWTTSEFTPSEAAELFRTDEESIDRAMKQLPLPLSHSLAGTGAG